MHIQNYKQTHIMYIYDIETHSFDVNRCYFVEWTQATASDMMMKVKIYVMCTELQP